MRVEKWDILMHRLLTEKKEKQLKEKAFAGKKELDNDEDGVPKWADKEEYLDNIYKVIDWNVINARLATEK